MPVLIVTHKSKRLAQPIKHAGPKTVLQNLYEALYKPYGHFVAKVLDNIDNSEEQAVPAESYFYPTA